MTCEDTQQQPIAIVGMACRLPGGVNTPDELWGLLYEGRTTWSYAPESRFQEPASLKQESKKNESSHFQRGHFLQDDITCFDAPFFNVSPAEAKTMDPQLRLLLESAYEAFENSGITLSQLRGTNTATYVALNNRDYEEMFERDLEDPPSYHQASNGEAMYSDCLSNVFNLDGPSFTLNDECSRGMVTLHRACESIRHGDCHQAIVGASSLVLRPADFKDTATLVQSKTSHGCNKSFDYCTDDHGRGEGVCTLVLKGLSAALEDSDTIRAVIRSSVILQDEGIAGITTRSSEMQESTIRAAYAAAGLDVANTSYVETIGSGTSIGDLAESRSIGSVIGKARQENGRGPVTLGSIKSNIGHLGSVSGLAAIIKAVLMLHKGQIPQAVNVQLLNQDIAWKSWHLNIPTQDQDLRVLADIPP